MSATVPTPPAAWTYPAEVLEYARQQGVERYLEPLRLATLPLFPTGQLRVVLHRDPELRDVTFIVYEMHVNIADVPDRRTSQHAWFDVFHGIVPSTQHHHFVLDLWPER